MNGRRHVALAHAAEVAAALRVRRLFQTENLRKHILHLFFIDVVDLLHQLREPLRIFTAVDPLHRLHVREREEHDVLNQVRRRLREVQVPQARQVAEVCISRVVR